VLDTLTTGELRIVDLVARGWTNQEVADHLNLRTKTVEWTLTNVYRKLNLRSRTELALKLAGLAAFPKPGVSPDTGRKAASTPLPAERVDSQSERSTQ
jgi:DNA-binding CsgD family transcriptional regulator